MYLLDARTKTVPFWPFVVEGYGKISLSCANV